MSYTFCPECGQVLSAKESKAVEQKQIYMAQELQILTEIIDHIEKFDEIKDLPIMSILIRKGKDAVSNNLFELMKQFEKRNNISIAFQLCSDGSCHFEEFWKDEILKECETIEDAINFLKTTEYELDPVDGRCYSPVRIKTGA